MLSKIKSNKRSASPPPIARIIFLSHLVLAAMILIGFAVVTFTMSYHDAYAKVESELLGAAEILSNELRQDVAPDQLELPDALFHRFGKASRDRAYWRLWDGRGRIIVSHGEVDAATMPHPSAPPTKGKHPYIKRFVGRRFELLTATTGGGQLLVGRPMAKEYDGFARQLVSLGGIILLGLLVAAGLAWWLTRWIVRPISSLAQTAANITHRDLDQRLDSPQRTLEMTQLADSFNSMLRGLQDAFLMQRQFTSDAAHELRTPVAIVIAQCELSLSKPRDPEHYRQSLKTCLQTSSHMKTLVDQLMQLSRLDRGRDDAATTLINLDELVTETLWIFMPLTLEHGVDLQTMMVPCRIQADSIQLRQLTINLVSNAIQFSHRGDQVHVSVAPSENSAVLTVRDTGMGISVENVPHLCKRFFQVDKARTTTGASGAGLGLSIVSEIIAAHDGELTIESSVGEGTTVRVALPLASEPELEPSI